MGSLNLDFSNAEAPVRLKPGRYEAVVDHIEVGQAEGKEHPYLRWVLTLTDEEFDGKEVKYITSLSPKSLWRLQENFQSFGLDADEYELEIDEDSNMLVDPDLSGELCIIKVVAGTYQGRPTAKVVDIEGGGEPEVKAKSKPKPKRGAPGAAAKVEEDEDEDEDEEEEEEEKPKRRTRAAAAKGKAKAEEDEDEDDDDEDDEEEEDEEEEKPKRASAKKSPFKGRAKAGSGRVSSRRSFR